MLPRNIGVVDAHSDIAILLRNILKLASVVDRVVVFLQRFSMCLRIGHARIPDAAVTIVAPMPTRCAAAPQNRQEEERVPPDRIVFLSLPVPGGPTSCQPTQPEKPKRGDLLRCQARQISCRQKKKQVTAFQRPSGGHLRRGIIRGVIRVNERGLIARIFKAHLFQFGDCQ